MANEVREIFFLKSEENIAAAKLLAAQKKYNAAANRAYYAVFQIVYQKLLRNSVVSEDQKGGKHKAVEDEIKRVACSSLPLFSVFLSARAKADYESVEVSDAEYMVLDAKAGQLCELLKTVFM